MSHDRVRSWHEGCSYPIYYVMIIHLTTWVEVCVSSLKTKRAATFTSSIKMFNKNCFWFISRLKPTTIATFFFSKHTERLLMEFPVIELRGWLTCTNCADKTLFLSLSISHILFALLTDTCGQSTHFSLLKYPNSSNWLPTTYALIQWSPTSSNKWVTFKILSLRWSISPRFLKENVFSDRPVRRSE